jgi:Cu/Ag efflux protein CusF
MNKTAVGNFSLILLIIFLLVFTAGCGRSQEKPGSEIQRYQFKGLVMALERSRQRVTIAHGDIPNHMKAMTMSFAVKDTNLLRGIEVGDSVSGVLAVRHPEV